MHSLHASTKVACEEFPGPTNNQHILTNTQFCPATVLTA